MFGIKKVSSRYVYILVYISNDAALINSDRLKTWKGTKTTISIEKILKIDTSRKLYDFESLFHLPVLYTPVTLSYL